MSGSDTATQDVGVFAADRGGLDRRKAGPIPRLRLLYHVDPSRIGAVSHPELALEDGAWQVIGRKAPLFITDASGDVWTPLDDPTVSREQVRVRWIAADGCFEVEPVAGTKRELTIIDVERPGSSSTPAPPPVTAATRVPVGACIAIGDRLLLGLELQDRVREPDDERLGIVGESRAVWQLRDDLTDLGQFDAPVLVLGETGAGKELVAAALHQHGKRASGPFQTINCAALPEHLVESMLFGHVKGAFTGADAKRTGVFESADRGTLFLDELGEMPMTSQPKLLRTLQDGLITPVGQNDSRRVDVRVVAATNRDPEREITAGQLRADLYHRLSAHVLRLPPLRARRFDVPLLFLHFLERCRREHASLAWLWESAQQWRPTLPMAYAIDLMRRPWAGNVRELQNVVQRVARKNLRGGPFVADDPALEEATAAAAAAPAPAPAPAPTPTTTADADEPDAPPRALSDLHRAAGQRLGIAAKTVACLLSSEELTAVFQGSGQDEAALVAAVTRATRDALKATLMAHDYAQSRVAKSLGVSPWTLIRLMQQLDVKRPSDLSREEVDRALAAAGGDLARAAVTLEISEHGLKKRIASFES